MKNFFLKIDASRRELKSRPDVQALLNQASAYRLSYLLRADATFITDNRFEPPIPGAVDLPPELAVVKAPTLDGTELWILSQKDLPVLCQLSGMERADIVATYAGTDAVALLGQLQWSRETLRFPDDRDSHLIGTMP